MQSSYFIDTSPEKVFPTNVPAARKMTNFLIFVHELYFFRFVSFYVEVNIPVVPTLTNFETIKLQRIDNTFVLPPVNFVFEVPFLQRENSTFIYIVWNITYIRILKINSCWPPTEFASFHVNLTVLAFL